MDFSRQIIDATTLLEDKGLSQVRVFSGRLQHRSLPSILREIDWATRGHRVFDLESRRELTFPELADRLASCDAVFFGETHDNETTHRLQRELLELFCARAAGVAIGLEMFERDVQEGLDDYLSGAIDEATFLEDARPWPNYERDYRPLIEFARERGKTRHALGLAHSPSPRSRRCPVQGIGLEIQHFAHGFAHREPDGAGSEFPHESLYIYTPL